MDFDFLFNNKAHSIFVGKTELQDDGKAGLVTIQGKILAVLGIVLICKRYLFITLFPDQAKKLLEMSPARGLLALGNVINALGDEKKRKEGVHVTYRDSGINVGMCPK
ncbi:hypothetical protein V6N11_082882 [Hibiscus sabdariffa]|uniref:Uncharacterized protein n=1 Tax=Hibiscus sabdariffa TaxID=183260 RepID=A0ABR2QK62_9ROSI